MIPSLLVLLASFMLSSEAAYCTGKPDPKAKPNLNAIDTSLPTFIKSCKNGKLYSVGHGEDSIPIVHIWGSPYEMGYAHGDLMQQEVRGLMDGVWSYLEEKVVQAINGTGDANYFPKWFLKDVADVGLDAALDMEETVTGVYTGKYFKEEIRGLADAAGIDKQKIERIHMIGELTKGACSMFGANASAVLGGGLLQLRALDWNVDGPFKNYPQITVYHPKEGNGHSFANIGWSGWIGSITGFSSLQLAISEIGVSFSDETFGKESRFGTPFTYLLRDILQFDDGLTIALSRITNAHRTCDLLLGVGDGKLNQFKGIQYSASVANFYTWDNLNPVAYWHPRIRDIVYWGMDWLCPGYSSVLGRVLLSNHGNLTAEVTIRDIVPIVQTGDLHIAVYDFSNGLVFVANAKADYESGPLYAYDRTFIQLSMKDLFDVSAPN